MRRGVFFTIQTAYSGDHAASICLFLATSDSGVVWCVRKAPCLSLLALCTVCEIPATRRTTEWSVVFRYVLYHICAAFNTGTSCKFFDRYIIRFKSLIPRTLVVHPRGRWGGGRGGDWRGVLEVGRALGVVDLPPLCVSSNDDDALLVEHLFLD